MNFTLGQQVRFVGPQGTVYSGVINPGSIGTVIRHSQIVEDWPVVHFPTGTHGPHSDFMFLTADRDLELVR